MNRKLFILPSALILAVVVAALSPYALVEAQSKTTSQSTPRGIVLNNDTNARVTAELKGHYYALIIGINDYQHLPVLTTAAPDARALATVLHDQYGFQTNLLVNATRDQITKALNDYRHNLDENASLLIYYAGHGIFDKDADKAYWLPVDADKDDNSHWIMADDITTEMKVIPAKHILIISDSCYSGGIVRDVPQSFAQPVSQQERDRFLEKMASGKSRTLMSSGALEPVSDGGGNGHSAFTGALLQALSSTSEPVFGAGGVFEDYIQVSVAGRSDQTPQYAPVRNSGHDFGDFVFVRSGPGPAPVPVVGAKKSSPLVTPNAPAAPLQPSNSPVQPPSRRADGANRSAFESLAGEYDFGAIVDSITVNPDGSLQSLLPGQPQYELEPTGDLQFNVKGVPGFSAEFKRGPDGTISQLISHQPTGSVMGERRSGRPLDPTVAKSLAGNFSNGILTVNFANRSDGAITYFVPGQPLYQLRYTHDLSFVIAGIPGVSIEFRKAGNGQITSMVVHMPNGDFPYQRIK